MSIKKSGQNRDGEVFLPLHRDKVSNKYSIEYTVYQLETVEK